MQHGEAASEQEDPARPLTPRGREEVGLVARVASRIGVRPGRILHSGKLRALETAEILARELGTPQVVGQADGLAPNDDPRRILPTIEESQAPLILVGHLPHLSKLCSLLLLGDPGREVVAFRMGALISLVGDDKAGWRLRWIIPPEVSV